MGKQPLFGAITTVTVLGSVFAFPFNPVNAQQEDCAYVFQTPASESREIEIPEFGIKFQIPANYHTEKRKSKSGGSVSVTIIDPGTFAEIKCCQDHPSPGCTEAVWVHEVSIEITPIQSGYVNLTDGIYPSYSESTATIANQEAIIYKRKYMRVQPPDCFINARFFTPDKRYLVDIGRYYGVCEKPDYGQENLIFQQILSTFQFT